MKPLGPLLRHWNSGLRTPSEHLLAHGPQGNSQAGTKPATKSESNDFLFFTNVKTNLFLKLQNLSEDGSSTYEKEGGAEDT